METIDRRVLGVENNSVASALMPTHPPASPASRATPALSTLAATLFQGLAELCFL